jgi:hypothetical protein
MKLESILSYEFSNNSVDINVIDGGAIKLNLRRLNPSWNWMFHVFEGHFSIVSFSRRD